MSEMMFKFKEIVKNDVKSPELILREQLESLELATDGVLKGVLVKEAKSARPDTRSVNIVAYVKVNGLEKYKYKLLELETKPEKLYPLGVSFASEQGLNFADCQNENGFISLLREILESDEVTRDLQSLYVRGVDARKEITPLDNGIL